MTVSDLPWSKFFWSDWESDEGLRQCSLAAQGLWMRMLCICAKSEPRGFLTIAGNHLDVQGVATAVGKPEAEIAPLMDELDRWGVFSRDRRGRIYSRRMTREANRSNEGRKHAKKRWSQETDKSEKNARPIGVANGPPNGEPTTQKPEARGQIAAAAAREHRSSRPPDGDDVVQTPEARAVCEIVQVDGRTNAGWWMVDGEVAKWLAAGCDLDADILPTIRGVMQRRTQTGQGPPNNPSYFANAVMEAKARRLKPLPDGKRREPAADPGGADVHPGSEVAGELRTWAALVHGLDPKVKARIRADVPAGRAGAPKAEALMAELGIKRSDLGSRTVPENLRRTA